MSIHNLATSATPLLIATSSPVSTSSTSSTSSSSPKDDSVESIYSSVIQNLSTCNIQMRQACDRVESPDVREAKRKITFKLAKDYIEHLGWSACYRSLLVKEAVRLHLIKLMQDIQAKDLLDANGACLFFYFIDRMIARPFHSQNRIYFDKFIQKLEACIKAKLKASIKGLAATQLQSAVETEYLNIESDLKVKSQLRQLSFFAENERFDRMRVGQVIEEPLEGVSTGAPAGMILESPELLVRATSSVLPSLANTVCLVLQEAIQHVLNEKLFATLQEVAQKANRTRFARKDRTSVLLNPDFRNELSSNMQKLERIFKAQRKILIIQVKKLTHQLFVSDYRSLPSMRFQIGQIFTSLRLLRRQIQQMAACTAKASEEIHLIVPRQQVLAIIAKEDLYFLNNGQKPKDDEKSILLAQAFALRESTTKFQALAKGKKDVLDEKMSDISKSLVQTSELLNLVDELIHEEAKEPEFMINFDSTKVPLLKRLGFDLEGRHRFVCDLLGQFYVFDYRFDICSRGIGVLDHMLNQYQNIWLSSISREEVDIDELWLQSLSDDLPQIKNSLAVEDRVDSKREFTESKAEIEEVVAVPKPKSRKRRTKKVGFVGQTTTTTTSSTSSLSTSFAKTTVGFSPSTYLQRLQGLRSKLLTKPATLEYLPAYLTDAAYHLGVFGSTMDLFKTCLSTGQRQFLPELLFGCVRSGSLMSEQLLTYHMIQERSAKEHRTHSHLELVSALDLSSPIRREIQSERQMAFLALADSGGVFSRYPHHTSAFREHMRTATLEWLLDPSTCSPQEFVRSFIGPAIHFMETLSRDSIEIKPLADVVVKEICAEIEGDLKALPLSPISGELQTKLASSLHLVPALIKTTQAHIEKIKNSRHPLKDKITLALNEVLYHLQGIEVRLNCFICFPQSIYLSAQVDAILTRLQFLDEQIEIALHMIHSREAIRTHHLELLRGLRDGQEEGTLSATVHHLDIAGGAQYVHFALNSLRKQGVTPSQMPRALTWRIDALDLSLHDCGEGMALAGANGKSIEVETLRNQVMTTIVNVLAMAKTRLENIKIS